MSGTVTGQMTGMRPPCSPVNSPSSPSSASSPSPSSSSPSIGRPCSPDGTSKDFITVVEIAKTPDDVNSEFVTVLSVGEQPISEEIAIYRTQGERIGMALKFEGGTGPGDPIDKVFVQTVNPDSPAARACGSSLGPLRTGDQILRIQGKDVGKMKRTDCVALLRDAPVCISLFVKREATGAASGALSTVPGDQCQGSNGAATKKGPPPPVPPRLSTTTLSTLAKTQCNNKNIANTTVTSPCVSPVQNGNGSKSIINPKTSGKKPPPLPPRRPRDPPPAAPAAAAVGSVKVASANGHHVKSASSTTSSSSSTSSSKRVLSSAANRPSDVNCSNQGKNKRSESSGKKQTPVITEAIDLTPEPAQVYMDLLDKEGALESESDDTCSSVSTIIDKFHGVCSSRANNENNCNVRKTPSIDLDAILAPFQQLEKELDSRQNDQKALQKFVDDTKAAMSDMHHTCLEANYSGVNLDDYDDIANVSPIVTSIYEETSLSSKSQPLDVTVRVDTQVTLNNDHGATSEMKTASVSPNNLRVSRAKVKEVKLLTTSAGTGVTGRTRGILKTTSTTDASKIRSDSDKDKSKWRSMPPSAAVPSAVQVSSMIPKLGLFKSTSSPVIPPRKSRSTGNLSFFETENVTGRPSLIPRPVSKNYSLVHSSKLHSQSTRDIHMSKSHQVPGKLSRQERDGEREKGENITVKSGHEVSTHLHKGLSETEQSDRKKMDKDERPVNSQAPVYPAEKKKVEEEEVARGASITEKRSSQVDSQESVCPPSQEVQVEEEEEASVSPLIPLNSNSDSSSAGLPLTDNVSRQPVFKEDQHLIKDHSAHDTTVAHHERDPVSVGDDRDEKQKAICSGSSAKPVATCERGLEKNVESSCSSGEDNTSPILLRSVKSSKVRHDDSGVFSEETDSPSPDCMSVKRNPFAPFHRLNERNATSRAPAAANDEIISTISCQSTSSSDPGVASISSDSLTDNDNHSDNGSDTKSVTNTNKHTMNDTLFQSSHQCENDKQTLPPPSVKERIALFQAVAQASSYKSLSKASKSLYDIRGESSKSHHSSAHRASHLEITSEVYSSSSSRSSESEDVVTNLAAPFKTITGACRRYTSNDSLFTPPSSLVRDTSSPLVPHPLDSRRHTKVLTNISPAITNETKPSEASCLGSNDTATVGYSRASSITPSSGLTSAVTSSPRASYSMSDLLSPSLASSSILSSLKIHSPKYSPALKRRNPEMLTRSTDLSQYTATSSCSLSNLTAPEASESVTIANNAQSTGDDASIDTSKSALTQGQVSVCDDNVERIRSTCQSDKVKKRGESEDEGTYVDSAKHFRELAQKWEERILRDRQQSKMVRSPVLSKQGPSAASSLLRKVVDDVKLQPSPSHDNLSLPPQPPLVNASSNDADRKVENSCNGSMSNALTSPVTCARRPIDNNNSPVARNSTLVFEEVEVEVEGEVEDESVTLREVTPATSSNSDRCLLQSNKVEKEKEKSDAFCLVEAVDSTENCTMSSIDSSTSDSGTSSPGCSAASITTSGVNCLTSLHSPSSGISSCKDIISRSNGMSNCKKNDQQYGSVTSLASSTSIISPNELSQLIEDAKNSIDSGELNCGPHCIQVVILSRDYSANGPVGISLAGGADCETKEITVHRIITGSIADRDGKVKKGDIILSINGRIMRGVSHREAVEVLRSPASEVVLVLARSNDSSHLKFSSSGLDSPSRMSMGLECTLSSSLASLSEESPLVSLNKAYKIVRASLHKDGAGLGFILEGGKDSPLGDRPLAIKKIFKGGLADKEGTLIAGDELICVNDQSVEHMTRTEAWNFLKKLPNAPVHMIVRRVDYGF